MGDINPYLEITRLVAASIVGALSGAFVAHRFTASREKSAGRASRKREFMGFMRGWRVEFDRKYLEPGGFARNPSAFTDALSRFVTLADGLRGDFSGEGLERFEALVHAVAACDASNFANPKRYGELLKAVDEITAYVEAA